MFKVIILGFVEYPDTSTKNVIFALADVLDLGTYPIFLARATTFSLMVEQMQMQISPKGRPAKLCLEDQVLLCLSYWR